MKQPIPKSTLSIEFTLDSYIEKLLDEIKNDPTTSLEVNDYNQFRYTCWSLFSNAAQDYRKATHFKDISDQAAFAMLFKAVLDNNHFLSLPGDTLEEYALRYLDQRLGFMGDMQVNNALYESHDQEDIGPLQLEIMDNALTNGKIDTTDRSIQCLVGYAKDIDFGFYAQHFVDMNRAPLSMNAPDLLFTYVVADEVYRILSVLYKTHKRDFMMKSMVVHLIKEQLRKLNLEKKKKAGELVGF